MCVSRRAWCIERCPHVRERLLEVILRHQRRPISRFYLMVTGRKGQERNHRWTPMDTDYEPGAIVAAPIRVHRRPSAVKSRPPAGRPANAGERETLRRATRRSGRIQSGCAWARRSLANPPAGRGPQPQGQSGAKPVRFAQRTLASGAGRWQHRPAGD